MKERVSINNIEYIQELQNILIKFNIPQDGICILGSALLAIVKLRKNNDIDIAVHPYIRQKIGIEAFREGGYISEHIYICPPDNLQRFGVDDKTLIENPRYHIVVDGFKIIRPEILLSYKDWRFEEKDQQDILLIEQYFINNSIWNWDWNLIRFPYEIILKDKKNQKFSLCYRLQQFIKLLKKQIKRIIYIKKLIKEIKYRLQLVSFIKRNDIEITIPIHTFLSMQYVGREFVRLDIIIAYMVLEEYFQGKKESLELYTKLQKSISNNQRDFIDKDELEKMIKIIVESNNYYEVNIDPEIHLIHGLWYIAFALLKGESKIHVRLVNDGSWEVFDIARLKSIGFSEREILLIEKKRYELFRQLGLFFIVILWPPMLDFFDEIENELRYIYSVIDSYDLNLTEEEFESFIRQIYEGEPVQLWKIERKIHALRPYPKKLRVIELEIPKVANNPQIYKIRMPCQDGQLWMKLRDILKIKEYYRNRYRSKIHNYVYDIIMHIGDNFERNKHMIRIVDKFKNRNKNDI